MGMLESYTAIPRAVRAGSKIDIPEELKIIYYDHGNVTNREQYNPQPENVLDGITSVIDQQQNPRVRKLKGDLGIRRSEIMFYYINFIPSQDDQVRVKELSEFVPGAVNITNKILESYSINGRPLDVADQLRIALKETNGEISEAVLSLALGTRQMARNSDECLFGDYKPSKDQMLSWKRAVSPFGIRKSKITGEEDTAGDTYHYWHNVMAGLSREEERTDNKLTDSLKRWSCNFAYYNCARLTELFRYSHSHKKGDVHPEVDHLGYETGRALYLMYSEGAQKQ